VGSLAVTPAMGPDARKVFVAWVNGQLDRRWPGGETGSEVVARFVAGVEALADRHRGETVLVVSHGGVMTLAIPNTAENVRPELALDAMIPNCAVAEVEVDADGWRLVGPWPGRRSRSRTPTLALRARPTSTGRQNRRAPTSSIPRSAS